MADAKMNKNPLKGTGLVYRFTLKQTCLAKGWLVSTILIAALLLIGIPLILMAASAASDSSKDDKDDDGARIKTVLVCDETDGAADYSILKSLGEYADSSYTVFHDMDTAVEAIADADTTVILRVTKPAESLLLTVYLPEDTELSRSQASHYAEYAQSVFKAVLMQKAELAPEAVALLSAPVMTETEELQADAADDTPEKSLIEELFTMLLPFLMMMTVYMMVILYGQSTANSVMLEKNSKLIETILTAVHPVALMVGKLFAAATAAVIQIFIWIACGFGGCIGGTVFALRLIPETENTAVLNMNEVIVDHNFISVPGIFAALLILALGFLLYLSLGAVSGAMASKAEDLSKTNVIFTMVLVVSFFLCFGSESDFDAGSIFSDAAWLRYFPFTALLINPGEAILGKISVGTLVISILLLIAAVILFAVAAAAIYKMLVLYRGAPPSPKKLFAMIKENRQKPKKEC